jgi:hypothetical protein
MLSPTYKGSEDISVAISIPITFGALDMDVSIPGPTTGAREGSADIKDGD